MNKPIPLAWIQALLAYLEKYQLLSEKFKALLPAKLKPDQFNKTTIVLKQGKMADTSWWIQQGYARAYYEMKDELGNVKQVTVAFWKAGVILTVSDSFFNRLPASHVVEFAAGSIVLGITFDLFQELAAEVTEANALAVKLTAKHYTETLDRVELLKLTAEERYSVFLEYYGVFIEQAFFLRDIASFLDMTPETLSRLRGKF